MTSLNWSKIGSYTAATSRHRAEVEVVPWLHIRSQLYIQSAHIEYSSSYYPRNKYKSLCCWHRGRQQQPSCSTAIALNATLRASLQYLWLLFMYYCYYYCLLASLDTIETACSNSGSTVVAEVVQRVRIFCVITKDDSELFSFYACDWNRQSYNRYSYRYIAS